MIFMNTLCDTKKQPFEDASLCVVSFDVKDILTTSGGDGDIEKLPDGTVVLPMMPIDK